MQIAFHNQTVFTITATVKLLIKLQSKYSPLAMCHRYLLQGYETLRCGWYMGKFKLQQFLRLRLCAKASSAPITVPVQMYFIRKILLLQRKEQFTVHPDTGITERQEIRIIVLQALFTPSATTVLQ